MLSAVYNIRKLIVVLYYIYNIINNNQPPPLLQIKWWISFYFLYITDIYHKII